MTNSAFTYLGNVVDRSGSMVSIKKDAEGGFNTFIDEQKKQPGRLTIYTADFDTEYQIVHPHLDSALVGSYTLTPRGGTALNDAIGRTIVEVGTRLAALPEHERPAHVIITITTDGEENSSREYSRQQVFDMITHQRETYGWEFIFLAANQDAIQTGASYGIPTASSLTFQPTGQSVGASYSSLSNYVTTTRSGTAAAFTDADRHDADPDATPLPIPPQRKRTPKP